MVGGSFTIYKGIVDLCAAKYRDSEGLYVGLKETAYCSLRSQLLMALHDAGANELCSKVDSSPLQPCCRYSDYSPFSRCILCELSKVF